MPEKTDHFSVTVDLTVELNVINPFDFFLEPDAEDFPFSYAPDLKAELEPYLQIRDCGPHFNAFVAALPREKKQTTTFLFDLNAQLSHAISYLIRMEPGIQAPEETLIKQSGSCRDSAWLLVQILRHMGLAARFASGYLVQLKADVKSTGRAIRRIAGFHRSACLVRSLSAGRRLGGTRSHLGPVRGRRPYSAGLRRQSHPGRADQRRGGKKRSDVRLRHVDRTGV